MLEIFYRTITTCFHLAIFIVIFKKLASSAEKLQKFELFLKTQEFCGFTRIMLSKQIRRISASAFNSIVKQITEDLRHNTTG